MSGIKIHEKKKNLFYSLWDGIFAGGMIGFTQEYFIPFLLVLGGTATQAGVLNGFANLFSASFQLMSPNITDRLKSRKKMFMIFIGLQVLMLLPMFYMALTGKGHPFSFILCVVLFTGFGAVATPAWSSLMSNLVPEQKRGTYFGWRNRIIGFIIVGFSLLGGGITHLLEKQNVYAGFAVLFGCAFLFRLCSWSFLGKMKDIPLEHKHENYFSLIQFLARYRESNFAKFVVFSGMLYFSVFVASPFFSVFMLKDLHYNYMTYSVVMISSTLLVYLTPPRWGRIADKVGNLQIIKSVSLLIALIPLFWIVDQSPFCFIVSQLYSGIIWGAYNLCALNFVYDAVSPGKRTRCIAYYTAFNAFGIAGGSLVGGFLSSVLPPLMGYSLITVFLVSLLLRLGVVFLLPQKIREVRKVEAISLWGLLKRFAKGR